MNERLRELYREAHSTRHYDGDPALDGNPPTVYWQGDVSAERFAQLILTEVTDILSTYTARKVTFYDGIEYNCEHPITAIRKHFGVEE